MDSNALRAIQEPLRNRYRNDSRTAILTLNAQGMLDDTALTCRVKTAKGIAKAGLHKRAGGTGAEICSGDMLLEALVACAGVSLRAAATLLDLDVPSGSITAEGDVDMRGCMGISEDVPVGFTSIRLHFDIECDAPREKVAELLSLTEQYCVVNNTLRSGSQVDFRLTRGRAAAAAAAD